MPDDPPQVQSGYSILATRCLKCGYVRSRNLHRDGEGLDDFPRRKHVLNFLHPSSACFVFLGLGVQLHEFFFVGECQPIELSSEIAAERLSKLQRNLNLAFFSVRLERDGHSVSCLDARMQASVPIDDEVLNSAPVPDCAAPGVTVDGYLDGNLCLAPNVSRVEWQSE